MLITGGAVIRFCLAAVFALAGLSKAADFDGFRESVGNLGFRQSWERPIAVLVPVCELSVAAALLPGSTAAWGAAAAVAMLAVFTMWMIVKLWRGESVECPCFGKLGRQRIGGQTLARNGVLALVAGLVLWQAAQPVNSCAVGCFHVSIAALSLGAVGVGVVALLLAHSWFLLGIMASNGRLSARVEFLEAQIGVHGASDHAGPTIVWKVGSEPPAFVLPSFDGREVSLNQIQQWGKPTLVVFSSPRCKFCADLLPFLADAAGSRRPAAAVVVISQDSSPQLADQVPRGLDFLLDRDGAVFKAYGVATTPSALVIGSDGRISHGLVAGLSSVRDLAQKAVKPIAEIGDADDHSKLRAPMRVHRDQLEDARTS